MVESHEMVHYFIREQQLICIHVHLPTKENCANILISRAKDSNQFAIIKVIWFDILNCIHTLIYC